MLLPAMSGGGIERLISTERRVAFLLNGNWAHFYWSLTRKIWALDKTLSILGLRCLRQTDSYSSFVAGFSVAFPKQLGDFFSQKLLYRFCVRKDQAHVIFGKGQTKIIPGLHGKLGYDRTRRQDTCKRRAMPYGHGAKIIQIMSIGRFVPQNNQSALQILFHSLLAMKSNGPGWNRSHRGSQMLRHGHIPLCQKPPLPWGICLPSHKFVSLPWIPSAPG